MPFFVIAKTVLRSIFRFPATRRYPFGIRRMPFDNTRGKVSNKIAECIFCGLCQRKCPTGAILVDREKKSWSINRLRCITCGCCVESCPKKCLKMEKEYSKPVLGKKEEIYRSA